MADQQRPAVLEWGAGRRPSPFFRLLDEVSGRLARVRFAGGQAWQAVSLAVLGGLALFGSLVSEWQTTRSVAVSTEAGTVVGLDDLGWSVGVARLGAWGTGWVVGAMLLVVCFVTAYSGRQPLSWHARTVGLAVAGTLVGVLVATSVSLSRTSPLGVLVVYDNDVTWEHDLARGVYLGYLAVLLIGAALWLLGRVPVASPQAVTPADPGPPGPPPETPPGRRGPVRARSAAPAPPVGPIDLTVGPAEPFIQPPRRQEWR